MANEQGRAWVGAGWVAQMADRSWVAWIGAYADPREVAKIGARMTHGVGWVACGSEASTRANGWHADRSWARSAGWVACGWDCRAGWAEPLNLGSELGVGWVARGAGPGPEHKVPGPDQRAPGPDIQIVGPRHIDRRAPT